MIYSPDSQVKTRTDMFRKLYFKQWIIGFVSGDIEHILRKKTFPQAISWIDNRSRENFQADPFILGEGNGLVSILYEDFSLDENYGNISEMRIDAAFNIIDRKILIDNRSHLSFPFIFREDERIFVFPESARTNSLHCYEYDAKTRSLAYACEIIRMPLYDPAILKHEGKYWLFGSVFEGRKNYHLHIFHSDKLMGPYEPHMGNPVKVGLNGTRAAGGFISADGSVFRPTQNCENEYGESITINRLTLLNESGFAEEPWMNICIDRNIPANRHMHTIHTINVFKGLIVVDGIRWIFSPGEQWRNFRRNRRILQEQSTKIHSR